MSLPTDFINIIQNLLGVEESKQFFSALSEEPSTSVRLNIKGELEQINSIKFSTVAWSPNSFYLAVRPQFTLDPLFHSGCYYVQEASSMFLWQALEQYVDIDAMVLDTCAAPGGKSTLIANYLSDNGFLVANEYVSQRAHILTENIHKWGRASCVVTNNDVAHFEQFLDTFDAVCVDAPCSGEGMFRKDDGAIRDWSIANIKRCVERQRTILQSAWECLKPNGVLVYSTCTYNRQENEENIDWLIDNFDAEYLTLTTKVEWNITETERGYRFLPHKTRGEGLFLAVVRKPDGKIKKSKIRLPKQLPAKADELLNWIDTKDKKFKTIVHKNIIYAIEKERYQLVVSMLSTLNLLSFGIPLAEIKGRDFIPNTALALSLYLKREQFVVEEVNMITALTFLRSEAINLPDAPRGYILITYQNIPLGWVKNVGNRCNNLYPSHWRIRMKIPNK